jgi:hypothetical protein
MKYIFTLFLFSSITANIYSQDSTITLSQFEQFTSQPNRIIKKEIRTIGAFGWRNINVFKATDMTTDSSIYSIRMNYFNNDGLYNSIRSYNTYIDFEELDTIIDVLSKFLSVAKDVKPAQATQYVYITANDIEFAAYYDVSNESWQYTMSKLYKYLRTHVPETMEQFNSKRFGTFVKLLKEASTNRW